MKYNMGLFSIPQFPQLMYYSWFNMKESYHCSCNSIIIYLGIYHLMHDDPANRDILYIITSQDWSELGGYEIYMRTVSHGGVPSGVDLCPQPVSAGHWHSDSWADWGKLVWSRLGDVTWREPKYTLILWNRSFCHIFEKDTNILQW